MKRAFGTLGTDSCTIGESTAQFLQKTTALWRCQDCGPPTKDSNRYGVQQNQSQETTMCIENHQVEPEK